MGTCQCESTLVGETIKNAAAFGEFGDLGVGLKLVKVETGFLSVEQIDFEFQAVRMNAEGARVSS